VARSNGFKFPSDNLTSTPYDEAEYARRIKAKTVNVVLNKTRTNVETANKDA